MVAPMAEITIAKRAVHPIFRYGGQGDSFHLRAGATVASSADAGVGHRRGLRPPPFTALLEAWSANIILATIRRQQNACGHVDTSVRSDFPLQAWYRVQQQTNKRPRNGLKQPLRPAQPVSELPRKLGTPHDVAEQPRFQLIPSAIKSLRRRTHRLRPSMPAINLLPLLILDRCRPSGLRDRPTIAARLPIFLTMPADASMVQFPRQLADRLCRS